MARRIGNVIGFDDAPFPRAHRGDIRLVGTVCSRTRLDGVLSGRVRRDGRNSTRVMTELLRASPFFAHVQAVLLQGIAVGGFNVVDAPGLSEALERPVLVVARRRPNLARIRRTLLESVPGGARKWRLIEQLGPMEPMRDVFVQRVGLSPAEARQLLAATTLHGNLPEALRLAHIIAGGVTTGRSRGRA